MDLFGDGPPAGSLQYARTQVARQTFHGDDYNASRDKPRLTGQLLRVWTVMQNRAWFSVEEVAEETAKLGQHDPAQSVARQIRYLRSHGTVERRHEGSGLYRYRFTPHLIP